MNMLSSQVDEIRTLANELDERERHMGAYVQAMREAADTIDALRKQIAKCQIAELKADYDTSRYFELFGTPERTARTLIEMCRNSNGGSCAGCPILGSDVDDCYDVYELLEWLKGEDEVIDEPDTIRNELIDSGLLRGDA